MNLFMKISLVVTVLNEEKTIEKFLDSIARQSLKPDEVIIVDGGSTDWTVNKLVRPDLNLRVLIEAGSNRSEGRNRGIQVAKNEIIAVTDCGCILDKDWLLEITKPFKDENVMAVAGYYLPGADTVFQKCVAPYFCVMPREIKERNFQKDYEFLPSSRSFAFRKSVWSKTGGYPQELNYCEDLAFDQKIKKAGYRFFFAPKAIVYWPQRKSLKSVFKQFFNYAVGDGQVFFSSYQTHSKKIALIYLRYFLVLTLFILGFKNILFWQILLLSFIFYILWIVKKNFRHVKNIEALFWLPVLQFTSDFAVMFGSAKGIILSRSLHESKSFVH